MKTDKYMLLGSFELLIAGIAYAYSLPLLSASLIMLMAGLAVNVKDGL